MVTDSYIAIEFKEGSRVGYSIWAYTDDACIVVLCIKIRNKGDKVMCEGFLHENVPRLKRMITFDAMIT
jgi:hypothetical protein